MPFSILGTAQGKTKGKVRSAVWRAGLLGLALALLLAGCTVSPGGSTRPGGYNCVTATGGCWTLLSLTHTHINPDGSPDIPGPPQLAESDVLVTPLACDAACQASSGSGNPAGYIANFMQLWQSSNNWYIRTGYETTPGGAQYFMQYWLGDLNPPSDGNTYLAPTQINPGYTGPLPYSTIAVGYSAFDFAWNVQVAPGYPPNAPAQTYEIGFSRFQPDYLFYGQVVYGNGGATARLSIFTNSYISTGGFVAQLLQEPGTPPGTIRTADHPTAAGWIVQPSTSNQYGGDFYVSCCQ
jgi:hypothetical protein